MNIIKYLYSIIIALVLMTTVHNASAQTVTIGAGTSTQYYAPINRLFEYGASEIIYLGSEIGTTGNITSIGWSISSGTNATAGNPIDIYMKSTASNTVATTTSTTGYTLVYTGSVPNSTTGFQTITLSTPFNFTSTSNNLAVLVVNRTNAYYTPAAQFAYTSTSANYRCSYYSAISTPWTSSSTMTQTYNRPNVRLVLVASCTPPTPQASALTNSNILETTARVTIGTRGGGNNVLVVAYPGASAGTTPTSGTTYTANLAYGNVGSALGTGYVVYKGNGASGTNIDVTNLTGNTQYTFVAYEYNTTGTCYNTATTGSTTFTTAFNPCTSIPTISCNSSYTASLNSPSTWNNSCSSFASAGQEQLYSFTPSATGTYKINISAASGGFVNYFYKAASLGCDGLNWNCIGYSNSATDVGAPFSSTGAVTFQLTAGTAYYFLLDGQSTGVRSHTFQIKPVSVVPTISIASNPADVAGTTTICSGTSVTFTATVGNLGGGTVGVAAYQWKKGGVNIAGQTASTYTTTTLANNDAITCAITSVTGGTACFSSTTPTSTNTITMAVNALPTAPGNPVVPTPGCNSTTITRNGTPSGSDVWYWQGTSCPTTPVTNLGSGSTYAANSSATYNIRAQSTNGCWSSTCGSVAVVVTSAVPVMNANPSNVSIAAGANTSFTAGATNSPTSYLWEVNTGSGWSTVTTGGVYTTATTATLTITGATFSMNGYQYRATALNACGSAASPSAAATLTVNYCTSTSTSNSAYITAFSTTLGSSNISNSSGYSTNGYSNTAQTVTQTQNGTVNYSATIFNVTGGVGFGIFVDWNQDGDFLDANENPILLGSGTQIIANPSGSFSVPSGANLGNTRMRVVVMYTTGTVVSCNSGLNGETEDYTFNVTAPCTGPTPQASSLSSSLVTQTSARVSIGTRGGGSGVILVAYPGASAGTAPTSGTTYTANAAYGTSGTALGTGFVVYNGNGAATLNVDITSGLTAGTQYTFVAYEYTGSGASICYNAATTGSTSFTTQPSCIAALTAPTATTGVCYAGSGAVTALTWAAVTGATSYDVYFGTIPSPALVVTGNTTRSYAVTLVASQTYYWRIVAINASGGAACSTVYSFVTAGVPCASCNPGSASDLSTYIDNFSTTGGVGNITNNSSGASANNYGDFTSKIVSQYAGSSISFSGTINYGCGFNIWVDWNNDGTFSTGEKVYASGAYTSIPSGSFSVPGGTANGNYRMRIMADYGTSNPSPCAWVSYYGYYGEVEDYTLTVVPNTPCSGTPNAGSVSPAYVQVASGGTTTLALTGFTTGSGFTYQWQSSSSPTGTFTNVSGGSGATTTSYTTAAITAITYYRCLVTCTNSGLSATSAVGEVALTYCTPSTLDCTAGDYITRVRLGTLDNSSTCGNSSTGFTNYANTVAPPTLVLGNSYTLTLDVNYTSSSYKAGVWIDYNGDGDYKDAGEFILISQALTTNPGTISIVVPTTATTGVTGMRVGYFYSSTATLLSSQVCSQSSYTYGEIEDYTVNLQCSSTPSDVTGKFPANGVSMTCGSEATLNWNNHNCATGYKIYVGTSNPPTTLVSTQTTNIYNTGPLASNQTYYWKVVPYNGSGDGASSVWSFTTNTAITAAASSNQTRCGNGTVTLNASGGAGYPDWFWYDSPTSTVVLGSGSSYSPTITQQQTFYVENALLGTETNIATGTTGVISCSTLGYGSMFDIRAKSADLIITKLSGTFKTTGAQTVKAYYRTSSYVGNAGSNVGWTLLGSYSVNPSSTTTPTIIDITDFQIPAGQTYGVYLVYNQFYTTVATTYANSDIEINTGSSICNTGEFGLGTEITDRTFNGSVYYKTNCASPRGAVVATPYYSTSQVILAPSTVTLNESCTEADGWTYYADPSDASKWLFAIFKNGNTFTPNVSINVKSTGTTAYDNVANTSTQNASFIMGRYWNVTLTNGSINGSTNPVKVRFFFDPADVTTMTNAANAWSTANPTTLVHSLEWFKTAGQAYSPSLITSTDVGRHIVYPASSGVTNNVSYQEYTGIQSFSGGTVGIRVSPLGYGLPVKILYFTAKAIKNEYIRLDWATALEVNNSGFEVERSLNGVDFEKIGWVNGNGNSTITNTYTLNDTKVIPNVTYYYRLKQIDFDSQFEYSEIVSAFLVGEKGFVFEEMRPNPANNKVFLNILTVTSQEVKVNVSDVLGQIVLKQNWQLSEGLNGTELDLQNLAGGTYTVTVISDGSYTSKKLVIAR